MALAVHHIVLSAAGDLATLATTFVGNVAAFEAQLQARLNQLGFSGTEDDGVGGDEAGPDFLLIQDICVHVRDLPDDSPTALRRHLADLQRRYLEGDRQLYDAMMGAIAALDPLNPAAALAGNPINVFGHNRVPPRLTPTLPQFKLQPAFCRYDRW